GQDWTVMPSLGFTPLAGLSHMTGASATDLWLVGIAGTIVRGDGTTFRQLTTSTTATGTVLTKMAALAPDDVGVTNGNPLLRHQATGGWKTTPPLPSPSSSIGALWRGGPNDLWAFMLDAGSLTPARLSRWNGTAWSMPTAVDMLMSPAAAWG